jgi:hypothetical protein
MKKQVLRTLGTASLIIALFSGIGSITWRADASVVDGGFETPNVPQNTPHPGYNEYFGGQLGSWDVGNFVTLYRNGLTDPITGQTLTTPDGDQAVLLRGSTVYGSGLNAFSSRDVLGSVSQVVHGLVAGGQYQVSFDLGALQGNNLSSAVQVQVVCEENGRVSSNKAMALMS